MTKAYVVQELNYQYNDEYYYLPEGGGGNPKVVFTELEKAQERMVQLVAEVNLADVEPYSWSKDQQKRGAQPFEYACTGDDFDFSEESF